MSRTQMSSGNSVGFLIYNGMVLWSYSESFIDRVPHASKRAFKAQRAAAAWQKRLLTRHRQQHQNMYATY